MRPFIPPEYAEQIMRDLVERSPVVQMMRRIERERRWGPEPRSVLFECGPRCHRHYCRCGTIVETGDPRMCTDEGASVQCFECAQKPTIAAEPNLRYARYVEYGYLTYDEL